VLNKIKERLKDHHSFSSKVIKLLSGTTLAQVFPILLSPILTRIYTPDEFGIFAISMSIAMILGEITTGKFELAIILPKRIRDSYTLAIISILLSFSILTLTLIIFYLLKDNNVLNNIIIDFDKLYLYIPLVALTIALHRIFYLLRNKLGDYGKMSGNIIITSLCTISIQIILGLLSYGVKGLIIGKIIGQFSGLLFLIFGLKNSHYFIKINLKIFGSIIKRYKEYPFFILPSKMMNITAIRIPEILIGNLFGSTMVGNYSLTNRVIKTPISTISRSFSDVFRETAVNHKNKKGNYKDLFNQTLRRLLFIGIPGFGIFAIISPFLFPFIFGESWTEAGFYASILSISYLGEFLALPLLEGFKISRKEHFELYWQVGFFISSIIPFIIGSIFDLDFYLILGIFSVSKFIVFTIGIFFCKKLSK